MLNLAAVSSGFVRAQDSFTVISNSLNIARYPDVIYPRLVDFSWYYLVATIPARVLIKCGHPFP